MNLSDHKDRRQRDVWQYCPDKEKLYNPKQDRRGFFERTGLSEERIEFICTHKKGVGSHILGAAGEFGLKDYYLDNHPDISDIHLQDDHNKSETGDFSFCYKGHVFTTVEVKTAKRIQKDVYPFSSSASISHRDRKKVVFPDGSMVETGVILRNEYDILAVNMWHCFGQHVFVFAKLNDLPAETSKSFTEEQKKFIIKSTVKVSWPAVHPFYEDITQVLDSLIEERMAA